MPEISISSTSFALAFASLHIGQFTMLSIAMADPTTPSVGVGIGRGRVPQSLGKICAIANMRKGTIRREMISNGAWVLLPIAAPSEPVKAMGTKGRIDPAIAPPVTIVKGRSQIGERV